jgi:TRAP transporter 4TM/12TM fusion protein
MGEGDQPAARPDTPEIPDPRLASQGAITSEALRKAEEFIEQEEGAANRLVGLAGTLVTAIAVACTLFHLYSAAAGAWPFKDFPIIATQELRYTHVAFVLVLSFLLFPAAARFRNRIRWWDVIAAVAAVGILAYATIGGEEFTDRATLPTQFDVIIGVIFIVLLIEATRRTIGWIVPAVAIAFIAYALYGPYLPPPWNHRGYDFGQLVGHLFMTLEGIFGVPVDVSSSLIILFTIYGAFLQHSGAGKFFIDFSMTLMGNKPNAAGRTVVLSSFLLGGPSGSGVATTVTIGAVAYPMMERSGFEKNAAGGLLAAGGLGAIISPPVLGAAAFLIAEFLKISYLEVIWMAIIPTCLFYLSLLFMVELDAKRFGARGQPYVQEMSLWNLTYRYGFHFVSLIAVILFMVAGYSPALSVFWSTVLIFVMSFLTRETALYPKKLVRALADGTISVLTAATTCAVAGIIVGVVTLTGLGLKFSSIVIDYAGGSLLLTAIYTALIVWIIGLAVPVTASYIICAVIAAPAMIKLGVPDVAAHMFIFYYSVLSEVSPPTALSPFAAAAITGGDPYKTTMQAWKYTLPAFLVPFVFVLDPQGLGLLLKLPKDGTIWDIVLITAKTGLGLAALAAAAQGWALRRMSVAERVLMLLSGLLLVFPSLLEALAERIIGRDIEYTATFGLIIAAGVLLRQRLLPAMPPQASGRPGRD